MVYELYFGKAVIFKNKSSLMTWHLKGDLEGASVNQVRKAGNSTSGWGALHVGPWGQKEWSTLEGC